MYRNCVHAEHTRAVHDRHEGPFEKFIADNMHLHYIFLLYFALGLLFAWLFTELIMMKDHFAFLTFIALLLGYIVIVILLNVWCFTERTQYGSGPEGGQQSPHPTSRSTNNQVVPIKHKTATTATYGR
ncbi:unnamed protein product [Bursaphelenchus xylophilus]|uniref:(pine wood nematode) hypothetical protein n=1 Tax=Bursaphelenchus xylophilus TaxID=6326 RepID=A0A1I7RTC5_BURXY|nr:unnamed protein product [Bursaphelenchus xylophilus]CAG9122503.1 unnamed protein product [Bursaphelenchus xylophilus]